MPRKLRIFVGKIVLPTKLKTADIWCKNHFRGQNATIGDLKNEIAVSRPRSAIFENFRGQNDRIDDMKNGIAVSRPRSAIFIQFRGQLFRIGDFLKVVKLHAEFFLITLYYIQLFSIILYYIKSTINFVGNSS